MEFQLDSDLASKGQRNIIPGNQYLFEAITTLKFGQWTVGFVAVGVFSINEIRPSILTTNPDSLGNQGVGRSLVIMLILGNDMHYAGNFSHVNKLNKPYQLTSAIGAQELARVWEC